MQFNEISHKKTESETTWMHSGKLSEVVSINTSPPEKSLAQKNIYNKMFNKNQKNNSDFTLETKDSPKPTLVSSNSMAHLSPLEREYKKIEKFPEIKNPIVLKTLSKLLGFSYSQFEMLEKNLGNFQANSIESNLYINNNDATILNKYILEPNKIIIEKNTENSMEEKDEKKSLIDLQRGTIITLTEENEDIKIVKKTTPDEYFKNIFEVPIDGPFELENGIIYEGQWANAMRHGYGKQIFQDGSFYEGYFKNDMAYEFGKLLHSEGDAYIGKWKNDKADGLGVYFHLDGSVYQGEWKSDMKWGFGVEIWEDGSSYIGNYEKGEKNGKGIFKWIDGSSYDGNFSKNIIDGFGTYRWPDGRKYEGDWKQNKKHGFGEFTWPDGRKYKGNFKNDQRNGFGAFTWLGGLRYEGNWLKNKQHGEGILFLPEINNSYCNASVEIGTNNSSFTTNNCVKGQWESGKLKQVYQKKKNTKINSNNGNSRKGSLEKCKSTTKKKKINSARNPISEKK